MHGVLVALTAALLLFAGPAGAQDLVWIRSTGPAGEAQVQVHCLDGGPLDGVAPEAEVFVGGSRVTPDFVGDDEAHEPQHAALPDNLGGSKSRCQAVRFYQAFQDSVGRFFARFLP